MVKPPLDWIRAFFRRDRPLDMEKVSILVFFVRVVRVVSCKATSLAVQIWL